MQFPLTQIAAVLSIAWPGSETVTGWSVDSRTIAPGDLFFALRGPNHDGNRYVAAAFERGAVAAVAESTETNGPLLAVPDVQNALLDIARWARAQWGGDVIAVTGSAGKTSTKDAIADLLSDAIPTGKTQGNFNNHVGLPLSILRLDAHALAAVLEIGMNHAGEIRALAAVARPRIAVVTNVGAAHIENFDSIDSIALAKRELVEALPADGVAALNADDPRVAAFAQVHPGRTVLYGLSPSADVRAEDIVFGADTTTFRVGQTRFETVLLGTHNVSNILAALAVAGLFDIAPGRLAARVRILQPGKMRGERFRHNGILILNDCYNSNPDAARAMIDVLAGLPAERRIAVLGEMLELGRLSGSLHRDVGFHAAKAGIAVLIGIRGASRSMVHAAVEAGMDPSAAVFFEEPAAAGDYVRGIARPGDAILFKGSRGTRVELALERLVA